MISAILLSLLLSLHSAVSPVQAQTPSADFCLARWEWVVPAKGEAHWNAPFADQRTGSLDMRSLPQMGTMGGLGGWGFFAYDAPMGSTGMHCFGEQLGETMTQSQVDTVALVLDLKIGELQVDSFSGVLQELYAHKGDPTGLTRWKPLRMSKDGSILVLGDRLIAIHPFDSNAKEFSNTLDTRWVDYRRNKLAGIPLEQLRKWNGYDMQALYGRMGDDLMPLLVPPEYQGDGWQKPATTITDNFSGDLSAWTQDSGTWVIAAGELNSTVTGGTGRSYISHNTSLSSDDHYVQANLQYTNLGDSVSHHLMLRFGDTSNHLAAGYQDTGTDQPQLYKRVANSPTVLASEFVNWTSAAVAKGEITSGDLFTMYKDGVQRLQVTETALSGNLKVGAWIGGAVATKTYDNFEAADLAAGAVAQVIIVD